MTSVGIDVRSSCAAIRAGIAAPSVLRDIQTLDPEDQTPIPLVAHPVKGYTDGFHGLGRWIRLARGAAANLMRSSGIASPPDPQFWSRAAILAVTRPLDDELFRTEPGQAAERVRREYLETLRVALGLRTEVVFELVSQGHAGTAMALQRAADLVASGMERVLILAVDSWLHPLLLERLEEADRLKLDERPSGLMPGEAGASLLVETERAARERGGLPLAVLCAAAVAREPNPIGSGRQITGRGLAKAISEALDADESNRRFEGDCIVDLNGETWRAVQWGTAQVHLAGRLASARSHFPASSVGDTGAASGALGICFAIHLLNRAERGPRCLVSSSSEEGGVGCVALRAP